MRKKFGLHKILVIVLCLILTLSFTSCNTKFVVYDGNDLNLDGYKMVFCDEFEGNSLDLSVWEYRGSGPVIFHGETVNETKYKGYFNHPDQVSVENGCLMIKGEYTTREYGEGWHAASIRLKEHYTYGYFEIKCIPNDSEDFWSAFWLQEPSEPATHSYKHEISQGGIYGAEIDIFETYRTHTLTTKDFITSSIHCNGADDNAEQIDSKQVVKAFVKDLRSTYTTFGMMWTKDEYIFYVNGVETGRTSFALGPSRVPESVIISLCAPENITLDKNTTTRFLVDYVKIYQLCK